MRKVSAALILVILAAGVVTAWIPTRWPISILEVGSFALAVTWCARSCRLSPVLLPFAVIPAWTLLQLWLHWTVAPSGTAFGALNWIAYLALVFAALQTFDGGAEVAEFLHNMLIFGSVVATAATLQYFTSRHAIFWLFPIPKDLVFVMGPFLNHGQYAAFIALMLPLALVPALSTPGRSWLYLSIAGLMIASVVASASRGGVVLVVIETLTILALRARGVTAIALKLVVISGGLTILVGWDGLSNRFMNPDPGRRLMLFSTLDMIRDHPWKGVGIGNWATIYPLYARYDDGFIANQAHNDWAQWTAEGGVVMLACMLVVFGLSLRQAYRHTWSIGTVFVFIYALIDYPFQKQALAAMVFTMLAATYTGKSPRGLRMMPSKLLLLSFCTAFCTGHGMGQSRPGAVVDTTIANVSNLPAQRIAPNDLIGISVYDAPELTQTLRVDADGTITLPLLKEPITADGLFPRQVEAAIAAALQRDEIINQPLVKVTVVEYYSRPISVIGAVHKPVTFQAVGTVTLIEALARAEGLNDSAGREIVVGNSRNADPPQHILVKELIEEANPAANLKLTGGDEIRVPEAAKVFVVGNVKRPGAFPVRDTADLSVLKIIALAEGLAPFPAKQAFVIRKDAAGTQVEIPVDLQKLMKRQTSDVALLPNDIFYVPDNNGKRLSMAALEKVILFGSTAGATALVWR